MRRPASAPAVGDAPSGRYLPEYQRMPPRTHVQGADAGRRNSPPEATLLPLQRFALDAAIVFADIMSRCRRWAWISTSDPGPVLAKPIRSRADVDALPEVDAEALGPAVLATLQRVRAQLANDVPCSASAARRGTLAAYLVEGRGVAGFPTLRAFAAKEPAALGALLAKLSEAMASYVIAQGLSRSGRRADIRFLGRRPVAGRLAASDTAPSGRPARCSRPAGLPRILFLQNAPHLVDAYAALPRKCSASTGGWTWRSCNAATRSRCAGQHRSRHPAGRPGRDSNGSAGAAAAHRQPRPHRQLGHGILPKTPIASVEALVQAVHGRA